MLSIHDLGTALMFSRRIQLQLQRLAVIKTPKRYTDPIPLVDELLKRKILPESYCDDIINLFDLLSDYFNGHKIELEEFVEVLEAAKDTSRRLRSLKPALQPALLPALRIVPSPVLAEKKKVRSTGV